MSADQYDKTTMRRHIYMAAVARQVENDLDYNSSFNLERLGNPMDPKVQADLDREAMELVRRNKAGDPALDEMLAASVSGSAWLKAIMTATTTMGEIEKEAPGSDGLVDIVIKHADITDNIVTPPVKGTMIPERLLRKLSFKAAELASVNQIMPKDLIDAVMDRVEQVAPNHPMKRLVSHVSLFLSMIAASPRDAEDAINMASAFLGRFRDEDMMAEIAMALEDAADENELQRCWILQLMTTARFRMANADLVISARPDMLTLVEVTDGEIRKGAATVSVPLEEYRHDTNHADINVLSTRH